MVRDRVQIRIVDFDLDFGPLGNVVHLRDHDVEVANLYELLDFGPLTYRNIEGQGGTHVMIGRDSRSRSLYVTLRATPEAGVWHPVTGWRSKLAHQILQQEGRL